MRRFALALMLLLLGAATIALAQVEPTATVRKFSLTGGGFASGFQPGNGQIYSGVNANQGGNYLVGLGSYVDVRFTHWFQIEAEGRWLYFNQYAGEHESNYLIGPRVPIRRFGRASTYGKVLVGYGRMTFPNDYGYGTFTALAYGGGLDYELSRKISIRAVDFEYQEWPKWLYGQALYPYGISVGVGYKVF
jgi:opacity protein-like surface antigen